LEEPHLVAKERHPVADEQPAAERQHVAGQQTVAAQQPVAEEQQFIPGRTACSRIAVTAERHPAAE
jgi:hypothetical protein